MESATILIIEDGDEYLDNLRRYVPGPSYLQAHCAADALGVLDGTGVDLIYLDMRFDRVDRPELVGDFDAVKKDHNDDAARAWRFLENNQGLFILDVLSEAGYGDIPVVLAYDFSAEKNRLAHIQKTHPGLQWVADTVTSGEIRDLVERLLAQ